MGGLVRRQAALSLYPCAQLRRVYIGVGIEGGGEVKHAGEYLRGAPRRPWELPSPRGVKERGGGHEHEDRGKA